MQQQPSTSPYMLDLGIPFESDSRPTTSSSSQSLDDDFSVLFALPITPPSADLWTIPEYSNTPTTISTTTIKMPSPTTSSSPTDFAFEPPSTHGFNNNKTPSSNTFTPMYSSTQSSFSGGLPSSYGGYSSASSFSSSTSGSVEGSSFSSAADLPAISREFARPSSNETRRPATAAGGLGSGDRFHRLTTSSSSSGDDGNSNGSSGTGNANGFFTNSNPFNSPRDEKVVPSQDHPIDPRYNALIASGANSRRASDGTYSMLPPTWPQSAHTQAQHQMANINNNTSVTNSSSQIGQQHSVSPTTNWNYIQNASNLGNRGGNTTLGLNRPQTSDGLPNYSNLNLPSARSLVGSQLNGGSFSPLNNTSGGGLAPAAHIDNKTNTSYMPFRDARSASLSGINDSRYFPRSAHDQVSMLKSHQQIHDSHGGASAEVTFVPLGGPAPKKRPRRRYDEIERLYLCGWNGCEKSYGTLNHLNAHVAMQKHGEKRLPQEFKEMRKAWRKRKRDQVAAQHAAQMNAANGQYDNNGGWSTGNNRHSISSSSGDSSSIWDSRRISTSSTMSGMSSDFDYYNNGNSGYDSRPSTASSTSSNASFGYAPQPQSQTQTHTQTTIHPGIAEAMRRASLSSNQNPNFPSSIGSFGGNGNGNGNLGIPPNHIPLPSQMLDGFKFADGDHPTPTPQNPFPGQLLAGKQGGGAGGFPFQTLTQPMPGSLGGGYAGSTGQFAFQR